MEGEGGIGRRRERGREGKRERDMETEGRRRERGAEGI